MPAFRRWTLMIGCILFFTQGASASGPAFVETSVGLDQMILGNPFYQTAPVLTGFGTTLHVAFGFNAGFRSKAPVWLQMGVWGQTDMISSAKSYMFAAAYPFVRLHIKRFFVTGGATPLVWKSETDSLGFGAMKSSFTVVSILAQVGYDLEITPELSMIFGGQNQTVLASGTYSPAALLAATVGFRFYIFPDSSFMSRRRYYGEDEVPYPGWRYPYGSPMH